ncbi:CgeB family protein [Coleofasciculus sp.]|uniref:CgeB family protein n=1 Tax=Coleofasciculus sp. TaxID=3100458 RepID=UPI0039FB420B
MTQNPLHIVMFCHSLLSDWNHGNAHFLRGIVSELRSRGHQVSVYEPHDAWSLQNLLAEHGDAPIAQFKAIYPGLESIRYHQDTLDLDKVLDGADLVIVHEWNNREFVARIGEHRDKVGGYRLLFHDTHHRSVSDRTSMAAYNLSNYDGVLAFGSIIRDIYLTEGWTKQAWTWHEAADTRIFHPITGVESVGDLVWIGNWGDEERTAELYEFLIEPIKALGIKAKVHGVRYPKDAIASLNAAGIDYGEWLPNYEVPQVFARFRVTIHVPRRFYTQILPGIPTIRVFEALACGIPLISAPWDDVEGLFTPGQDFLIAHTGEEMQQHLKDVLHDPDIAQNLAQNGRRTILERHTCAHRVDELLDIYTTLHSI